MVKSLNRLKSQADNLLLPVKPQVETFISKSDTMIQDHLIAYMVTIGIVGLVLIWWSKRRIVQTEKQRKHRITKIKRFEPSKTTTPMDTPLKEARESAVDNIENRFSIIRKLSFFSIVTIWIIALIFPFLNRIPATFISILVAASGVVIGVAARPFIENLISGIVISFSHPVRIGDTVIIDDIYGYVEDINLTHTVVKQWNWRRYVIPNSSMLSKEIINCSINDTFQWTHVEFFVAYDTDLELVKKLAVKAATSSKYFADYEVPRFWVMSMDEKGSKCWIAAWADSPSDAWELGNEIRTQLIKDFHTNKIKAHSVELNLNGNPDISAQNPTSFGIVK